jgi:thiol:disulfide interchange protein
LRRRRNQLLVFDKKPGEHIVTVVEVTFFVILSLPLWFVFQGRILDWSQVWMNLNALMLLVAGWTLVRWLNRKAARAIGHELDALDPHL